MNGICRNFPDAEESQYMVDPVRIKIVCHFSEPPPPPLKVVFFHCFPVVCWEAPVLAIYSEIVGWGTCLAVHIEVMRFFPCFYAIATDSNGDVTFQYQSFIMRVLYGFGRGRRGNVEMLRDLSQRYGFWLEVIPPVAVDGQVVSSRAIRGLLIQGRVAEAQRLLGRPYCLVGEVERGDGRGRHLGFATANLPVPDSELVKDGVYAGRVLVRGAFRDAMMNLGSAPTFGGGLHRLEIHIPGWEEPLYGERIVAYFLARLRDEQRFVDAGALRVQLGRDREAAEAVWRAAQALPWPEWSLGGPLISLS